MKKFQLGIIIFGIFIFCGCSVHVDLIVKTNQKVEMATRISMPKEYILSYYQDIEEAQTFYKESLNEKAKKNKYSLKLKEKKENIVGEIKSKQNLHSKALDDIEKLLFKKMESNQKSYILSLSSDLESYLNPMLEISLDEDVLLKEITLNIQFHNVIENANSDSYHSKTNTHTWIINKENLDRNIEFTIANKKRYDIIMTYFLKKYFLYGLVAIILIVITLFIIYIIQKSKRENSI